MTETLARKLRFGDVAYAIDATPKALRLWLQRELVQIRTPRPDAGRWTEYSFADVAILALVRVLSNFGVDVPTANAIANKVLGDHFFPGLFDKLEAVNASAGALALPWSNRRLRICRASDGRWEMQLIDLWKERAQLPAEPAAYLSIDVESVLRTAFARATESVNEGEDLED